MPMIEKGIPVLCEKPFAETFREAATVEAAARKAGVKVAVNQNFRRHFTFSLAKEILENGVLGRPLHLLQSSMMLRRDIGWRLDRRRYVMAVMTIHWFDGYRYLFGMEPATVYCRALNSPATAGGPDTAFSVTLGFPEDVVVSLSESFSSYSAKNMCTLDCERGGLEMGYEKLVEIRDDGSRVEHTNPYDKAEATWYVLDDLLTSVEEDREPETSAADNLGSMRILEAAYRSSEECRVVGPEEIE
jgi:predicted dehydrogenase